MKKKLGYLLLLIGLSPAIGLIGIAIYYSYGFILIPFIMAGCILKGLNLLGALD